MNINIQISDDGTVTRSQTDQSSGGDTQPSSSSSSNQQDGGGPGAQLTGAYDSSPSAAADTTDIGAPPQWLHDAIAAAKSGSEGSAVSSAPAGGGSDGGTAPSF